MLGLAIGALVIIAAFAGGGSGKKKNGVKNCWTPPMPSEWETPMAEMMADPNSDPAAMYTVADILDDQGYHEAAECVRHRADYLST
jgi:hypothetical protein